ncbi:hypothetical protein [Burkholderia sp. Ac-20379]|uniref:hypothetical protein n=1 Tax=Burkholderia sp. Ac-20379 TaxID=2703900 RepID=UPI001980EA29|nr:hypothetical protein [Burkholderia sp. Ac-20379]MBN3725576.1 hypothetical protein [Burkholderia sp. Ac-20379]
MAAIALLHALSWMFNGFCYADGQICWPGWGIALFGILGLPTAQLSWIANPLFWVSVLLLVCDDAEKDVFAVFTSLGALVLGNAFWVQGVNTDEGGGALYPVSSIGFGYGLWMTGIVLSVVVALHGVSVRERRRPGA